MTEKFFTIDEGNATYLCRKTDIGCEILAHRGVSGRWIKYSQPHLWKWFLPYGTQPKIDPKQYEYLSRKPENLKDIPKEKVTAILLMGKNERTL